MAEGKTIPWGIPAQEPAAPSIAEPPPDPDDASPTDRMAVPAFKPDRAARTELLQQPPLPTSRAPIAVVAAAAFCAASLALLWARGPTSAPQAPRPRRLAAAPPSTSERAPPPASEISRSRTNEPTPPRVAAPEPARVEASPPGDVLEPTAVERDATPRSSSPRRARIAAPTAVPGPDPVSTLARARQALTRGHGAEAIAIFRQAARESPSSAEPYRGLGDTYRALGNRPAAMGAYRHYLTLAPDAPDAALIHRRIRALSRR